MNSPLARSALAASILCAVVFTPAARAAEPADPFGPESGMAGSLDAILPKPPAAPGRSADEAILALQIEHFSKIVETRYKWIFQKISLSPEAAQELTTLLAERQMEEAAAYAEIPGTSMSVQDPGEPTHTYGIRNSDHLAEARSIAAAVAPVDEKVHALLGDKQYPIYQSFINTVTIRTVVLDRLQSDLALGGDSLNESQAERLIASLAASNDPLKWTDSTRAFITDAVVQDAQGYLTAIQIAALKNMQVVRVRVEQAIDRAIAGQNSPKIPTRKSTPNATAKRPDLPAGKTYVVNLSVPFRVGERYTLVQTRTVTERESVARDLEPPAGPQGQRHLDHLEGEVEVLAVFPNGGVQKAALTVKTLSYVTDDRSEQSVTGRRVGRKILPAGTKVMAESVGGKTSYRVDGKPPASTEIAASLKSVFELDDGIYSDQAAFGPAKPISPTAANTPENPWPVNSPLIVAKFTGKPIGNAATCTISFFSINLSGDEENPVASLTAYFSLKNLRGPFAEPILTKTGTGSVGLSGDIPAQHKGTSTMRVSKNFSFEGVGPGPDGVPLTKKLQIEDTLDTTITYH
jgi:hypothetical protein